HSQAQIQTHRQTQIQVLAQSQNEELKQGPLAQAKSSACQLNGTELKLSQLTEEGRLRAFMQTSFQDLLLQEDSFYAQALQEYYTFYSDEIAQGIWRSLADEYVHNGLELMLANTLYQNHIAYQYQAHFALNINLAPYKPYRATFFLPACDLYINVFNCLEADLDKPQEKSVLAYQKRREQVRKIHSKHGIRALEICQDKILDGASGSLIAKVSIRSEQRLHTMQALVLEQLKICPRQAFANPVMRSQGRAEQLVYLLSDVIFTLHAEGIDGQQLKQALSRELQALVDLLHPLYCCYLAALKNESAIDFEQMIQYATDAVRTGAYQVTWRDILIDEFQDISPSRFALIQAIREQKPDIRLFCVGDDWQSIYQFAGSQVRYTRDFEKYFGASQRYTLDMTFRFHQALCDFSTRFIQANPSQTRKDLKSFQAESKVGLSLFSDEVSIERILEQIVLLEGAAPYGVISSETGSETSSETIKASKGISCLILARFSHLLPGTKELSCWQALFPQLQIKCSTIHASKGKEADYVIVLGNQAGQFGLPSDKQSHPLIQIIRQDDEGYPYAQERRVFYVAITRARQHVYLLYSVKKPSAFIQELQAQGYTYLSALAATGKKRPLQLGSAQQNHVNLSGYSRKVAVFRRGSIHQIRSLNLNRIWQRTLKNVSEWVRGN
ncbi:MAG: UvrD-helicase domain-containing protein, partial [Pelistega sp.]|nr:UvrD-helicase domain-containing protein [Pelistega sp.]